MNEEPDLMAELENIKTTLELCAIRDAVLDGMRRHWSEAPAPSASFEKAAWGILRVCCGELGVELPLLRWFGPETLEEAEYAKRHGHRDWPSFSTDEAVRGAWNRHGRTVWVAAGLPLKTMLATIAHEVAHAAGGDEEAAQRYERRWADNLPTVN